MAFPYRHILCSIDFDDNSLRALDKAIEIVRHFQAKITVIHVVRMVLEFPDTPNAYARYQEQERAARARLNEIAAQKLSGVAHESAVYTGDIAGSILEAVDKFEPDLLVMATHGRTGLAHLFLGSVAEAVLRKARCPVLTIRPDE